MYKCSIDSTTITVVVVFFVFRILVEYKVSSMYTAQSINIQKVSIQSINQTKFGVEEHLTGVSM